MEKKLAMIIEDDEALSALFARSLQRANFDTLVIQDGSLAIVKLSELVPDIVVLDLGLPYVSGLGILAQIRADERLADTRVIVATGSVQKVDGPIHDLADEILLKPVGFRQLRELAKKLVSEDS